VSSLDKLVEEIFDTYGVGAVFEPGRERGSEKEFLTRLGLALRVREPDLLAFPEQLKEWSSVRLRPFDDSYFLPKYGLSFEEVLRWITSLLHEAERRLNACMRDGASIMADTRSIHAEFIRGAFTADSARLKAQELSLGERLDHNRGQLESIHIFSDCELALGISIPALQALTKQFGIEPGQVGPGIAFPHDENPLEYKTFVRLPDGRHFFLDPASAYRILAKTFERDILADGALRDRYLKNRDRATERWVAALMRRVFSGGDVYTNYFVEAGGKEKDLLVRFGDTVILLECKNSRIRPFKGSGDDPIKFEEDFKNSIQLGYEQALEVKHRILENQEATFLDEKGNPFFTIKRGNIRKVHIVCVTVTPRGPFGTDLSYELERPGTEPFPLAIKLFDLDTICKHIDRPEQFIAYLSEREGLHGRVRTGDELNFAGYFFKYGNLDLGETNFLTDDFSGIFDRAWYKEMGIEVEEPEGPPARTIVTRKGNRVHVEHSSGRHEAVKVSPELVERASGRTVIRMKGSKRNNPCPRGSGRKFKHCHGV
jgi:hypothetical protein